jgi:microcystin-dependent protein
MADPFIGEIRMFGFNFPPVGWAFCDGQLLPISQNTQLFSILGTTYGGNGTTNFGLPNFQGIAPMQQGQGGGLTPRKLGDKGGSTYVTLTTPDQLPAHTHLPMGAAASNSGSPAGNVWGAGLKGTGVLYVPPGTNVTMTVQLDSTGGGQPHNNIPPYLVVNFCIALQGLYPQRP